MVGSVRPVRKKPAPANRSGLYWAYPKNKAERCPSFIHRLIFAGLREMRSPLPSYPAV
jgi:hypothetical protein